MASKKKDTVADPQTPVDDGCDTFDVRIRIDWSKLRQQKAVLATLIATSGLEILEGALGLYDAIQDYAVDQCGIDHVRVFGFSAASKGKPVRRRKSVSE